MAGGGVSVGGREQIVEAIVEMQKKVWGSG